MKLLTSIEHNKGVKCSTFGASYTGKTDLAFGDFGGRLNIIDLETKKVFKFINF
jgi:hypothetical protein